MYRRQNNQQGMMGNITGAASGIFWMMIIGVGVGVGVGVEAHFLPRSIVGGSTVPADIVLPSMKHARNVAGVEDWDLEYYSNPEATHPNFTPLLNIRFPSLTRRQFRKLRKLYGRCGGMSFVTFSENDDHDHDHDHDHDQNNNDQNTNKNKKIQSYDILDFLAPSIQATWGHRFQPEDEFGRAPLFYQCYGFLLDVLSIKSDQRRRRSRLLRPWTWFLPNHRRRQQQQRQCLTISTPDSKAVYEAFQQRSLFVSDSFGPSNDYARNDDIQPGDVILIYHDNSRQFREYDVWLDHLVMYVDEGLLLEKSGSGVGTTFRLIDYGTFEKSWGIGVFEMQVRRPKQGRRNRIDIVRDLTIGGALSLPIINTMFNKGELKNTMPGKAKDLCGSYDDDGGRVLYTKVIDTDHPFEYDERNRASLPPRFFQPFLKE